MYLKVYNIGEEVLVAVADEDCLGRELAEGAVCLKVTREFYGEEHADRDEVVSALHCATIANLVGRESVAAAVEAGFVDPDEVMYIQGVPHAQMVCM